MIIQLLLAKIVIFHVLVVIIIIPVSNALQVILVILPQQAQLFACQFAITANTIMVVNV